MKIQFKGGDWKNAEDEVLKAAVRKYGKQAWGRVASLITSKTAAQCKARYDEFLNPSINHGEWTAAEEQQLLKLYKALGSSWLSIASQMPGRTKAQCQMRYEIILDRSRGEAKPDADATAAEDADGAVDADGKPIAGGGEGDATATAAEQRRKIAYQQYDHHPESKPAKADAHDLDDAQRDMLDAARGRLANEKGKKSQRKERERRLDESKQRAELQRNREMQEAGLGELAGGGGGARGDSGMLLGMANRAGIARGPFAAADDEADDDVDRPAGGDDDDFVPVAMDEVDGTKRPPAKQRKTEAGAGDGKGKAVTADEPAEATASLLFDAKAARAAAPIAAVALDLGLPGMADDDDDDDAPVATATTMTAAPRAKVQAASSSAPAGASILGFAAPAVPPPATRAPVAEETLSAAARLVEGEYARMLASVAGPVFPSATDATATAYVRAAAAAVDAEASILVNRRDPEVRPAAQASSPVGATRPWWDSVTSLPPEAAREQLHRVSALVRTLRATNDAADRAALPTQAPLLRALAAAEDTVGDAVQRAAQAAVDGGVYEKVLTDEAAVARRRKTDALAKAAALAADEQALQERYRAATVARR